jgi:hypothetical protein
VSVVNGVLWVTAVLGAAAALTFVLLGLLWIWALVYLKVFPRLMPRYWKPIVSGRSMRELTQEGYNLDLAGSWAASNHRRLGRRLLQLLPVMVCGALAWGVHTVLSF